MTFYNYFLPNATLSYFETRLYFGGAFVRYDLFFSHLVLALMSSAGVDTKRGIRAGFGF